MPKQLLIPKCILVGGLIGITAGCVPPKVGRILVCSTHEHPEKGSPVYWWELKTTDTAKLFPFPPPVRYRLYSLEQKQLDRFFAFFTNAAADSSRSGEQILSVPLPGPIGCRFFRLRRSDVLSAALQQKYPNLIALRGLSEEGGNDLRLEYDGKKMKGQVIWQGQIYLIDPLEKDGAYVYVLYAKEDAGVRKRMFEETDESEPGQKSDH